MFCGACFSQFMDLRTRYTALVTLITQYVKFASETLKRAEDEEVRDLYLNTSWLAIFTVLWMPKLKCTIAVFSSSSTFFVAHHK